MGDLKQVAPHIHVPNDMTARIKQLTISAEFEAVDLKGNVVQKGNIAMTSMQGIFSDEELLFFKRIIQDKIQLQGIGRWEIQRIEYHKVEELYEA